MLNKLNFKDDFIFRIFDINIGVLVRTWSAAEIERSFTPVNFCQMDVSG